ncbi:LysR family transcriptional regulator [Agrilactobacillus yilanensis]|uniref:LysR family transcriptional regulator n=1 Tax=Agrilactobacillus yilanensis TaxID=2485997 RepID=A0ABW4J5W6_9LACO|nr:LysR family transcriptional regulator [Agrilactobacillus yilanensis]
MNMRHLLFFKELARTQHMSKAAENLGISQPTLSYAIDKLEEELGVPLFEKDGRNIRLTNLGKIYLQFITRGLAEIDRGKETLEQSLDSGTGRVKLGFTYTMGQRLIPELITQFKQRQADQKINFEFVQNNTRTLLKQLLNNEHDLVVSSYLSQINDQETTSSLEFIPLVKQEIVLAVPPNHPLADRNTVSIQELAKYPLVYFSKSSGLRPLIDGIFKHAHVKPNIICEIEEDHTIVGFVQYNYGIALIPNLPQLDKKLVHLIHLQGNPTYHQIYLVYQNNRFMVPAVTRFRSFMESYCKENFSDTGKML